MDSRQSSPTPGRPRSSLRAAVLAVLRGNVSAHQAKHPRDQAARENARLELSIRNTQR